jgi:uncharacterized membrane protein
MKEIYLYLLTIPVFLGVDMIWLGLIAPRLYKEQIGHLMAESPNWAAAIVFYLVYIVGILVFVVIPAHTKDSIIHAVFLGGLFGMIAYATYDLTNFAVLKNWPLTITIIDIAWGTFLTAVVSTISFYIAKWVL